MSDTFSALQLFSTLALGEGLKEKDSWPPLSILVEIHVIYNYDNRASASIFTYCKQ